MNPNKRVQLQQQQKVKIIKNMLKIIYRNLSILD